MSETTRSADLEIEITNMKSEVENARAESIQATQMANKKSGTSQNDAKVLELNQTVKNMINTITDMEESSFKLRSSYTDAKNQLDVAQAEAEYAKELLNKLKYNKNDQLAEKLLEYANEQQKIRLKELRATRRAEDLEEQNKYKN